MAISTHEPIPGAMPTIQSPALETKNEKDQEKTDQTANTLRMIAASNGATIALPATAVPGIMEATTVMLAATQEMFQGDRANQASVLTADGPGASVIFTHDRDATTVKKKKDETHLNAFSPPGSAKKK